MSVARVPRPVSLCVCLCFFAVILVSLGILKFFNYAVMKYGVEYGIEG